MASIIACVLWLLSLASCYELVVGFSWIVFPDHRKCWKELIPFYVIIKAMKWAMSRR